MEITEIFLIIKNFILQKLWFALPAVQSAIISIRSAYSNQSQSTSLATSINYHCECYRSAYIYLYFSSHLSIIYKFLTTHFSGVLLSTPQWFHSILISKRIRVCALGGGPGTDVCALAYFFKDNLLFNGIQIEATVLDKHIEWKLTSHELIQRLPLFNLSALNYQLFDFFEYNSETIRALEEADLVTISKFLSAVAENRAKCSQQLFKLLQKIKVNSVILFLDNSGGGYDQLFEGQARIAGFQQISSYKGKITMTPEEQRAITSLAMPIAGDASKKPQIQASVAISLWKKVPQPEWNNLLSKLVIPAPSFDYASAA